MCKIILIYSPGMQADILYSELVSRFQDKIIKVYEMPTIPSKEGVFANLKFLLRIIKSSPKYLYFNLVVISFYNLVSIFTTGPLKCGLKKFNILPKKVAVLNQQLIEEIKLLNPDIIINGTASILNDDIISVPSIGVINYHSAPLPKYRGAGNYFWMLMNGLKDTHGTLHFIDHGLDTGPIISKSKNIKIYPDTTVFELWSSLRIVGACCINKFILDVTSGKTIKPQVQSNVHAMTRSFPKSKDMRSCSQSKLTLFSFNDYRNIVNLVVTGRLDSINKKRISSSY